MKGSILLINKQIFDIIQDIVRSGGQNPAKIKEHLENVEVLDAELNGMH